MVKIDNKIICPDCGNVFTDISQILCIDRFGVCMYCKQDFLYREQSANENFYGEDI